MAISLPVPVKNFARLSDTEGVGLGDMPAMAGSRLSLRVGETTITNTATDLVTAVLLNQLISFNAANHDEVWITARDLGATDPDAVIEQWILPINDFTALASASAGDTLDATSGGQRTAIAVEGQMGGGTLLIGHTAQFVMLIQVGTWSATSNVGIRLEDGYVSHNNGFVARKIEPLKSHTHRRIIVHRHAATRPAAPTAGEIRFDGDAVIPNSNSEWADINLPISGTDPLWLAAIDFQYIFSADIWRTTGTWTVYPADSTFRVQYSSTSTGPWVASDPGTEEAWVRYRLADGTWSMHQIRGSGGAATRRWRTIVDATIAAARANITETFSAIDLADIEFVSLSYQGDRDVDTDGIQGVTVPLLIPASYIRSPDPTVLDSLQNEDIVYTADVVRGGTYVVGGAGFPNFASYTTWYQDASDAEQRGHFQLEGAARGDSTVTRLYFFRGYRVPQGRVIMRVL